MASFIKIFGPVKDELPPQMPRLEFKQVLAKCFGDPVHKIGGVLDLIRKWRKGPRSAQRLREAFFMMAICLFPRPYIGSGLFDHVEGKPVDCVVRRKRQNLGALPDQQAAVIGRAVCVDEI